MRLRRAQDDDQPRQAFWLTTYADMVTLLLCFFVLLYAMSNIDVAKFQAVISSLQSALGILQGSIQPVIPPTDDELHDFTEIQARLIASELAKLEALGEHFIKELEKAGLADKVAIVIEERGLMFRFADTVLFDVGKADLRDEGKELLMKVAGLIRETDNPVRVEGHTDNWPINTPLFPSNWELSTRRATTVVRYLVEDMEFEPGRFQAAGYSEYHPIDTNVTSEGRQKNRRVDVILLRPSITLMEPR